jgi:undecaprenyl-diphosphatase
MPIFQRIQRMDAYVFTGINCTPLRTKSLDALMLMITQLGEGWVEFLLLTGIWYISVTSDIWYQQSCVAILIAGIICQLFKRYVPRLRPLSVMPQVFVVGPRLFKGSFPSGHTATAFALATIITFHWPDFGQLVYTLAAVVGISRVYVGAHFPCDVLTGAGVGILTSMTIVAFLPVLW